MTASFHASTRARRSVLAMAAVPEGGAWMMAGTLEDVPTVPGHALTICVTSQDAPIDASGLATLAMIVGDRLVGIRRMAQF